MTRKERPWRGLESRLGRQGQDPEGTTKVGSDREVSGGRAGRALPPGHWLHPESSSVSLEGSICWSLSAACFLPVGFWGSDSLLLFCMYSLSFSVQTSSVSADIVFSRTLWVLVGVTSWGKSHMYKYFGDKPSLPALLLRMLRDNTSKLPRGPGLSERICEAHLYSLERVVWLSILTFWCSWILAKGCIVIYVAFFLECTFLRVNFLIIVSFAIWKGWEFWRPSRFGSFFFSFFSFQFFNFCCGKIHMTKFTILTNF